MGFCISNCGDFADEYNNCIISIIFGCCTSSFGKSNNSNMYANFEYMGIDFKLFITDGIDCKILWCSGVSILFKSGASKSPGCTSCVRKIGFCRTEGCGSLACKIGACNLGACNLGVCDSGVCNLGVCDSGVCDSGAYNNGAIVLKSGSEK